MDVILWYYLHNCSLVILLLYIEIHLLNFSQYMYEILHLKLDLVHFFSNSFPHWLLGIELFGPGLKDLYYTSNDMDPYLKDKDVRSINF